MTPTQASAIVDAGFKAAPGRSVNIVSTATDSAGPLGGFLKVFSLLGDTGKSIFGPSDLGIPGTAPIAAATARAAARVGDATAHQIDSIGSSVATGVASGAKWGALILVLIVGVWVWSVIKPRG